MATDQKGFSMLDERLKENNMNDKPTAAGKSSFDLIEFKKTDGPPGPPRAIRLSPKETKACLVPYGFKELATLDIGPYNYVSLSRYSN